MPCFRPCSAASARALLPARSAAGAMSRCSSSCSPTCTDFPPPAPSPPVRFSCGGAGHLIDKPMDQQRWSRQMQIFHKPTKPRVLHRTAPPSSRSRRRPTFWRYAEPCARARARAPSTCLHHDSPIHVVQELRARALRVARSGGASNAILAEKALPKLHPNVLLLLAYEAVEAIPAPPTRTLKPGSTRLPSPGWAAWWSHICVASNQGPTHRRRRPTVARRPRRRYRPRHPSWRAPSRCCRPPDGSELRFSTPTACWLAARTLRGPSPPAEGVCRRRCRPLRRCRRWTADGPVQVPGDILIIIMYDQAGPCAC